MYVSVKGGEKAINNAHSWLSEIRRGDVNIAELNIKQISDVKAYPFEKNTKYIYIIA